MDFTDLLKNSLAVVTGGYVTAHDDLIGVIDRVRKALLSNAGEQVALELKKVSADVSSTVFRLFLDPSTMDPETALVTITYFRLPSSGYPIEWGSYKRVTNTFEASGEAEVKEELEKFFGSLLTQPESTLVQAIGFAMRQGKT